MGASFQVEAIQDVKVTDYRRTVEEDKLRMTGVVRSGDVEEQTRFRSSEW
jgi:hypothetical protein